MCAWDHALYTLPRSVTRSDPRPALIGLQTDYDQVSDSVCQVQHITQPDSVALFKLVQPNSKDFSTHST
jgi:hypothetical protein